MSLPNAMGMVFAGLNRNNMGGDSTLKQIPDQATLDAEALAEAKKASKFRRTTGPSTILGGGLYGNGLPPVGRKTLLSGVE